MIEYFIGGGIVFLLDLGIALIMKRRFKKKETKTDEELIVKIQSFLNDGDFSSTDQIESAKELCRYTKGKFSSGIYVSLDMFHQKLLHGKIETYLD